MSRRTLVNLALLLVAAGLAAFIALAPREVAEPQPVPLTAIDAAAVSRLEMQPRAGDYIELARGDEGWRIVRPLDAPANEFRVLALLGLLGAPVHARFDAAPGELVRYGLDPPQVRVRLGETELALGDTEPLSGRRYVSHDGQVALVDDAHLRGLDTSAASFVSPALLGPAPEIVGIRVPGLRLRLEDGRWLTEPAHPETSTDRVVALVDAWRTAQAALVQPYDATLAWRDTVTVTLEGGELEFDLLRGAHDIVFGLGERGVQYRLPRTAGERLLALAPAP